MNTLLAIWLVLSFWTPFTQTAAEEIQASPGVSFVVESEASEEFAEFTILLKNESSKPLVIDFPTSKMIELYVLDEAGSEVFKYSKGRSFLQAITSVKLDPGETKEWNIEWNYLDGDLRVPKGPYRVKAQLESLTWNGETAKNKQLKATAELQIPAVGESNDSPAMEDDGEPASEVFQGIKVTGSTGEYMLSGKARPESGAFFYTVEDGHNQLLPETKIETTKSFPQWNDFQLKISIPPEKLPKTGTLILNLYEKTDEVISGGTTAVILEQFRQTDD